MSRYIQKTMNLENLKQLTIWNGGSISYGIFWNTRTKNLWVEKNMASVYVTYHRSTFHT